MSPIKAAIKATLSCHHIDAIDALVPIPILFLAFPPVCCDGPAFYARLAAYSDKSAPSAAVRLRFFIHKITCLWHLNDCKSVHIKWSKMTRHGPIHRMYKPYNNSMAFMRTDWSRPIATSLRETIGFVLGGIPKHCRDQIKRMHCK